MASADSGHLVIAMGLDGEDHDEVHYGTPIGGDVREILRRGIELLPLALEAAERVNANG